ncbi:MAG: hypothetical protein AMXMBFR58_06100 [Phycisphaerae bacterium]
MIVQRPASEWHRSEAELERLRDLPVGDVDPAARERELERRQDELEWQIAVAMRQECKQ